MDCSDFERLLDEYEELTQPQKNELEEHAAGCEKCGGELEFYRSVTAALNTLPKIKAPSSLIEDVNKRLDAQPKAEKPAKRFIKHIRMYAYRYGAAAACVAIMATVGVKNSDLVNKMLYHDDGVISEETASVSPTEGASLSSAKPTLTAAPVPTAVPNPPTSSTAPVTSAAPAASASPATSAPAAAGTASRLTSATIAPRTAARVTIAPRITVAPRTTTEDTAAAYVPAAAVPARTSAPAAGFDMPTETETEQPAAAQTQQPQSEETPDPAYTFKDPGYSLPNETYRTVREGGDTEDYAASDTASEWAAAPATLTVSAEDEERVRELIEIYTSDRTGDQYTIDSDRMEYMLEIFKQEGIEFNNSAQQAIRDVNGEIMFTLVIA